MDNTTFNLGGTEATATTGAGVGSATDANGLVFNLNDVGDAPSFEVMPKGTYDAVIESFEFGDSSKGTPMITVLYTITAGEFDGRKVYDYMVLGGEGAKFALPKLKQLLLATAPDIDMTTFNPSEVAEEGTMVGRECQLKLKITTQKTGDYKGEKRNQVAEVLEKAAGSFM